MRAVMEAGGKQYRVAPGEIIDVERYPGAVGETVTFDKILLLQDEAGVTVDPAALENARVVGEVVGQGRAKKVIVFKKKRRKNYRRTQGHRQWYTRLKIAEIVKE